VDRRILPYALAFIRNHGSRDCNRYPGAADADVKTGEIKIDAGLLSAKSCTRKGNPVIPIPEEIMINKLSKGMYKLEVRAFDSAGRSTTLRETSFTVE